jgi:hypothetical protein
MGDPTEPGEDQETTIIIEGPPADATEAEIEAFNAQFEQYKNDMSQVLKKWKKPLKARLRKIEYVKKDKKEENDEKST